MAEQRQRPACCGMGTSLRAVFSGQCRSSMTVELPSCSVVSCAELACGICAFAMMDISFLPASGLCWLRSIRVGARSGKNRVRKVEERESCARCLGFCAAFMQLAMAAVARGRFKDWSHTVSPDAGGTIAAARLGPLQETIT